MLLLCFFLLLMFLVCHAILSSIYCSLVVTCLERADLLALLFVVIYCVLSLPHGVSWVKCGTWVYRLLIFACFLTLRNESKIILRFKRWPKNCCFAHMRRKLFNIGRGGGGGGASDANLNTCGGILQKCTYKHACAHTSMYIWKHMYMLLNVHTPMHACTDIYMHACTCRYIITIIYLHSYMKIKASALYDIKFWEQKSNKENLSNIFSRAKGYLRETNKSQNINPISPTPKFTFVIIQIKVKSLSTSFQWLVLYKINLSVWLQPDLEVRGVCKVKVFASM